MGKAKKKRVKKQRKSRAKKPSSSGGGGGGGGYGVSKRSSGGGVMQSLRSGFKRAAGVGDDEAREERSSTLSNVLWTLLLLGALAFALYRWYG